MEPGLAWAREVDLRGLNSDAAELDKVRPSGGSLSGSCSLDGDSLSPTEPPD